jgi:hypothetical protein
VHLGVRPITQRWTLYEEDIRRYDPGDCERGYDESRAVAGWMVRMEGVFVKSVDSNRRWDGSVRCLGAIEGGVRIPGGEV